MIHFLRPPTIPLKLLATPLLVSSSPVLSPILRPHSRNYFSTGSRRELSSDRGSDKKTSGSPLSCKFEAVRLNSRSLVKLQGADTLTFLQGLITNDIHHFESKPAIYALFLNQQGRILWDTLLFNVGEEGKEPKVLIECDSTTKSKIIKHFETFKLRKKVKVVNVDEDKEEEPIDLWVVFDHGHTALAEKLMKEECCGSTIPTTKRPELPLSIDPSLRSFGDPRLPELGWRILVPRNKSDCFPPNDVTVSDESSYKKLRYVLGVGEGVQDIPSGSSFPLESNGDYLHGISFHKGCYIGQELTARTHHTGVVRKRIMPFRLPEGANLDSVDPSTLNLVSSTASSRSLGKIRGVYGSAGIGLIRIEGALTAPELKIENHKVEVEKPFWWPKPASKEIQSKQ